MLRNVRALVAVVCAFFVLFLFWKFLNNGQTATAFPKSFRADRVTVSVYYESLCPDSIKFVRDQLWGAYNQLKAIMDVDLVPYGKASYHHDGTTWSFTCQHGPQECKGNKLQACAVKLEPNPEVLVPFVHCVMTSDNPPESGKLCSKVHRLDWDRLSKCAEGTEGNDYLHEMGVRTENLKPTLVFVPWININGNHTNDIQDMALTNLKLLVCKSYEGSKKPSACE